MLDIIKGIFLKDGFSKQASYTSVINFLAPEMQLMRQVEIIEEKGIHVYTHPHDESSKAL